MHNVPKTVRAADIVFPNDDIPTSPAARRPAGIDMDAVLHDIWRRLGECGTSNRNAQLVMAIKALIDAGVNTKARIVGAAVHLGFNRGHAGAVLSKSEDDEWGCGNGVYHLLAANQV